MVYVEGGGTHEPRIITAWLAANHVTPFAQQMPPPLLPDCSGTAPQAVGPVVQSASRTPSDLSTR